MKSFSKVIDLFSGVKTIKVDHEYTATCPVCNAEKHLYITLEGDKVLLFCQKCKAPGREIAAAVGLSMNDLFLDDTPKQPAPVEQKLIDKRTHIYTDADGNPVARKDIKKYPDGKKCYWQRYDKSAKKWEDRLNGMVVPLYNLPALLKEQKIVFVVEGEKDADTLAGWKLAATTLPNGGGATKWHPEYNEAFANKGVVILTDNDDIGRSYGEEVARNVSKVASQVRVVHCEDIHPGLMQKGDITDIVEDIGTDVAQKAMMSAIEAAPIWKPSAVEEAVPASDPDALVDWSKIVAQSAADIDFTQTPQPTPFIDDILTEGVYLLNAFSKVGKSRLMLQMLLALSTGSSFLGRKTMKCDTLYLALEDERIDYENRLFRFLDGSPAPENLYTLTRESFPNYNTPTLDSTGGLEIIIENHLKNHPDTKVIGIDVLSKIRSKGSNKDFTQDERKDLEHLLMLTAKHQIAIVVAHHVSVTGMRGSTKRSSSIGSGAGSYQISGTVTGEYEMAVDAENTSIVTFRVNGRRIRAQAMRIEDNYPMWSLVGDADTIRKREKELERESKLQPLVQTIEYLVNRDTFWRGRVNALLQENQLASHLLPMCAAPSVEEMTSRDLLVMLKRDGYAVEKTGNGSGSALYKCYRLGNGIETEQMKITG